VGSSQSPPANKDKVQKGGKNTTPTVKNCGASGAARNVLNAQGAHEMEEMLLQTKRDKRKSDINMIYEKMLKEEMELQEQENTYVLMVEIQNKRSRDLEELRKQKQEEKSKEMKTSEKSKDEAWSKEKEKKEELELMEATQRKQKREAKKERTAKKVKDEENQVKELKEKVKEIRKDEIDHRAELKELQTKRDKERREGAEIEDTRERAMAYEKWMLGSTMGNDSSVLKGESGRALKRTLAWGDGDLRGFQLKSVKDSLNVVMENEMDRMIERPRMMGGIRW
jgi:hypothetical protein